jgi:O-antigen/teichoic acid export membrane protein
MANAGVRDTSGSKSIGRNAGYNLAGAVIPLTLSLVTVPVYLKLVGTDRYGVLAIAWIMLGYLGLFDLGLGRATAFRIAALRDAPAEERATTLWTAIIVNLGLGLIGAAILWAAAHWFFSDVFKVEPRIRPEIIAGVPFLAMTVPVATMTGVLTGALQGREQFLRTNTVSVTSTVLFQLFPLGVAWAMGPYLPRLLLAALAARLIAIVILCAMCHAEVTRDHPVRIEKARIKELLSFGGWISLTSFVGAMLLVTDRFLIGAVLGAVAVTLYSIPFQLAQRMAIVPSALTTALFPRLSAAPPEEQERLGRLAFRTLAALMTFPVLGGVLLIGPFLELWVGRDIGGQAAPVARLLLIGFWINAFALLPLTRLQARGRPDLVTKCHLLELAPYLAGLTLAMKLYGLVGCAVMFGLRCLLDLLLLSWMQDRRIGGLAILAPNLALLALAAALSQRTEPFEPLWLGGSALLLASTAALGLASLPIHIREKLVGLLVSRSSSRGI